MNIHYIDDTGSPVPQINEELKYDNYWSIAHPLEPRQRKKYKGPIKEHPSKLLFGNLNDYLSYLEAWTELNAQEAGKIAQNSSSRPR